MNIIIQPELTLKFFICYYKIMLGLRKIVFYTFAFVYLILCPLIVARMLGFVIDPLTHHLVKTGLVYVSTNPPDATVYIDGRVSHQKTPTVIRDLTPGEHFIRIELRAYNDWERNVPIVAKKATVLANTLLIPEEWPIKKISQQPYQNIFFVPPDILMAVNPELKKIHIFHTTQSIGENQKIESLGPALSQPLPAQEDRFLINGKNDLLVKQGEWIKIFPKKNFGAPEVYDITKSKPSTNIYFEEKNGELFYLDEAGFLSMVRILSYRPLLNIPIPDALRLKPLKKDDL